MSCVRHSPASACRPSRWPTQARRGPLINRLLEDTSRLEAQVEKTLELARLEGGGALDLQPLPIRAWLERQVEGVKAEGSDLAVDLARER